MSAIQVNEIFGPTIQGEGIEVGYPCFFLRLHNCPVHCPGCDTYYTWNGTEKHKFKWTGAELREWFDKWHAEYPGCGLVISGGEPLIHYNNTEFIEFVEYVRNRLSATGPRAFVSVETSGFFGPKSFDELDADSKSNFRRFINAFSTVHCSPKVTPCLHGEWSDEKLLQNIQAIMWAGNESLSSRPRNKIAFKLVVKDQVDIDKVIELNDKYQWTNHGHKVFLMPYGNNKEEIIKMCDFLVPTLAKTGFLLSPRLHSIVWGNVREK